MMTSLPPNPLVAKKRPPPKLRQQGRHGCKVTVTVMHNNPPPRTTTRTICAILPSSLLFQALDKPSPNSTQSPSSHAVTCKPQYETERGFEFQTGDTFFRHESATGRDLGVLAASVQKKSNGGKLRVLDAMCGCGIRSMRYLSEASADFVQANDANEDYRSIVVSNLSRVVAEEEGRWKVKHSVANRVMAERYIERDHFDFIDVDLFGSDCMTDVTDGYTSGGHRPNQSLASYGAYIHPMPYANEIGLWMLIGGAVREASVLGYHVSPFFSYNSYNGPVFRVLLRVNRGKLPYGMLLWVYRLLKFMWAFSSYSVGQSWSNELSLHIKCTRFPCCVRAGMDRTSS